MLSITLKNIWNWPLLRGKLRPADLETSKAISRSSLEYWFCTNMYNALVCFLEENKGKWSCRVQGMRWTFPIHTWFTDLHSTVGHLGTFFGVFRATKIERRPGTLFHGPSPLTVYAGPGQSSWRGWMLGTKGVWALSWYYMMLQHFGFSMVHHFHTSHLGETIKASGKGVRISSNHCNFLKFLPFYAPKVPFGRWPLGALRQGAPAGLRARGHCR